MDLRFGLCLRLGLTLGSEQMDGGSGVGSGQLQATVEVGSVEVEVGSVGVDVGSDGVDGVRVGVDGVEDKVVEGDSSLSASIA